VCRCGGGLEKLPGRGEVGGFVVGRWTKSSLVGVGTDAGCDVEA
jgi:hypothetical protein